MIFSLLKYRFTRKSLRKQAPKPEKAYNFSTTKNPDQTTFQGFLEHIPCPPQPCYTPSQLSIKGSCVTQKMRILGLISVMVLFCSCSRSPSSISDVNTSQNIINGLPTQAQSLSARHTVAIGYKSATSKNNYSIEPFCTGIVISQNLIITAAHCIQDDIQYKTLNEVLVFFGTEADTANQDNIRTITLAKLHPEFTVEFNELKKAVSTFNDIALIKIKGSIPKTYLPADLIDMDLILKKNTALLVTGWGLLQVHPDLSTLRLFETTTHVLGYWRSHILHDDRDSKTGFCNGDSGGPGYLQLPDKLVLVGLVRGPHYPYPNCQGFGEFTSVGFHKNFILDGSKELETQAPTFVQIPLEYLQN